MIPASEVRNQIFQLSKYLLVFRPVYKNQVYVSMTSASSALFRVVVLISGRGSNLRALVKVSETHGCPYRVVKVISDQAKAEGLVFASEKNIPTAVVSRRAKERSSEEFNEELAEVAAQAKPDLIVLAGFMRVVLPNFINRFSGKIINIHPSLLPAFKGLNAQEQAVKASAKVSGCTVHYVVPELDSGPIIAQTEVPLRPNDTAETLAERILVEEHKLLPTVVKQLAKKTN